MLWCDDCLRWVCGFANAQGGRLLLGVNDKGRVVGLPDAAKLLEDLPNKVRDLLGIVVDVNLHTEAERVGLERGKHFRVHYQQRALALGVLEMTVPDKPQRRLQKYRLTPAGRPWLDRGLR